jgi:hypothetical protein
VHRPVAKYLLKICIQNVFSFFKDCNLFNQIVAVLHVHFFVFLCNVLLFYAFLCACIYVYLPCIKYASVFCNLEHKNMVE